MAETPSTAWAVIGAGRFATDRMVPAILATPGVTMTGVWARNTTAARTLAEQSGADTYPDVAALMADPRVDIVYVASTAAANTSLVTPLLMAGIPVLCEKPLAPTAEAADEIAQAARRTGVPCFVNHHLRANSCVTELKRALHSGALGEIAKIEIVNHQLLPQPAGWRVDDPTNGGVVRDLTTHDIDLLHHLVGDVHLTHARNLDDTDVETRVAITMTTRNGAPVTLSDQWITGDGAVAESSLTVHGTKGTARIQPAITATGSTLTIDNTTERRRVPQTNDAYTTVAKWAARGLTQYVPLATADSAVQTIALTKKILDLLHPSRKAPQ